MNFTVYFAILIASGAGVTLGAVAWYRLVLPRISKGGAASVSSAEVFEQYHERRRSERSRRNPALGGGGGQA